MRILATKANVEQLFKPTTMPYVVRDENGTEKSFDMPAWQCRACAWKSLKGAHDLPFPHECQTFAAGGTIVAETFTT